MIQTQLGGRLKIDS